MLLHIGMLESTRWTSSGHYNAVYHWGSSTTLLHTIVARCDVTMDEYDDAAFDALGTAALDSLTSTTRPAPSKNVSGGGTSYPVQPVPNRQLRPSFNAILVSDRQKGNPVLAHIRNVPWEYSDVSTDIDFILGSSTAAFYLSLKYHRLHPEYIYNRMSVLGRTAYNLRLLLVVCDIDNHIDALRELTKTSVVNNYALILAWSSAEAGRYLELYKVLEGAGAGGIREKVSHRYSDQVVEAMTSVRAVNRTDSLTSIGTFGSFERCVRASEEELSNVPGWGPNKVKNWIHATTTPFRVRQGTSRVEQVQVAMSQRAAAQEAATAIHNASTTTTTNDEVPPPT